MFSVAQLRCQHCQRGVRQVYFWDLELNTSLYVGGLFGPWTSVRVFPQAAGDLPGCGGQGVGPGSG